MRRYRLPGTAAALLIAGQACTSKESRQRVQSQAGGEASVAPSADSAMAHEVALVRIVNAVAGLRAVDVYAGAQGKFTGVEFRGVTPYATLAQNTPTFRLVTAGAPDTAFLAEERAIARDGHYYTILAIGSVKDADSLNAKPALVVVRDDLVPADSTKGRLRVLNAAGAGALDVFLDGDTAPLFDHLEVRDDDGFKDLDTGWHSVAVRADGETVSLLRLRVEVKPGQSITLVLAPPAAGRKLASIIITDELTPAPAPRGD